jgi:hypothetical protein
MRRVDIFFVKRYGWQRKKKMNDRFGRVSYPNRGTNIPYRAKDTEQVLNSNPDRQPFEIPGHCLDKDTAEAIVQLRGDQPYVDRHKRVY